MAQYIFHADINKFDAKTTRYYGENAMVLVDCARLAYQPETEIRKAMQDTWKFKNFKFFDNGKSTQGFVAGNDAIIIVAFRGTEGKILDLLSDAKMNLTGGCKPKPSEFPGGPQAGVVSPNRRKFQSVHIFMPVSNQSQPKLHSNQFAADFREMRNAHGNASAAMLLVRFA